MEHIEYIPGCVFVPSNLKAALRSYNGDMILFWQVITLFTPTFLTVVDHTLETTHGLLGMHVMMIVGFIQRHQVLLVVFQVLHTLLDVEAQLRRFTNQNVEM